MALVDPSQARSDARGGSGQLYTIDDALRSLGFGRFQLGMLIYAGLAWLGDAMEMLLLSFLGNAVKCQFGLTETQKDWVTASVFLGMMVGAQAWGALSDAQGRKIGFLVPAAITALAGFASAGSRDYPMLLAFRCLVGLGLGGVHVPFALFMEFVPSGRRGFWLSVLQGFWTIGALFEAGLAWVVMPWKGWRALLAISAVPLVVLIILYPWLPESPHYLLAKGETRKAEQVLEWVARVNGVELPPGTLRPVDPEPDAHSHHHIQRVTPRALLLRIGDAALSIADSLQRLFSPSLRRIAIIFIFVWLTNALTYYGLVQLATEYHKQGEECLDDEPIITKQEYRQIFVTTIAEVPGVIFAGLLIDSLGRRPLLGFSLLLTALALFPLVFNLAKTGRDAFLFISRLFITTSFTTIFVYTPEVYPTTVRSFGFGVNNAFSRIGGLSSPFIVGQLTQQGRPEAAAGVLMVFSFLAGVATFFVPVETSGKALKETLTQRGERADMAMVPGKLSEDELMPNPAYGARS